MSPITKDFCTQIAHLYGEHSERISCLVFNNSGTLLASAGLDGTVCVWNTTTWNLLNVYYSAKGVTVLAWFSETALICGVEDGILSSVVVEENNALTVSGFWAHLHPIEHLSVCRNIVASGAHSDLNIWTWNENASLACLQRSLPLPVAHITHDGRQRDPTAPAGTKRQEVLITGVYWASSFLIVAYMYHGIRFFDKSSWKQVRCYDTTQPMIRTSLSTHGAFLVAFNAMEGYDAYDLNDGKVIGSFTREPLKHEVPILFDLDGEVVISGSTRDVLSIWCVKQRRQLEFLRMPNADNVSSVAAHHVPDSGQFVIATGVLDEHAASSVLIWSRRRDDDDNIDRNGALRSDTMPSRTLYMVMPCVHWVVVIIVIAAVGFALYDAVEAEGYDEL